MIHLDQEAVAAVPWPTDEDVERYENEATEHLRQASLLDPPSGRTDYLNVLYPPIDEAWLRRERKNAERRIVRALAKELRASEMVSRSANNRALNALARRLMFAYEDSE